jgi:hypothetical protein
MPFSYFLDLLESQAQLVVEIRLAHAQNHAADTTCLSIEFGEIIGVLVFLFPAKARNAAHFSYSLLLSCGIKTGGATGLIANQSQRR